MCVWCDAHSELAIMVSVVVVASGLLAALLHVDAFLLVKVDN
jgi:hypothetical protein